MDPSRLAAPPDNALEVVARLERAGYEAYFVGGCVRDRLLGRTVGDWDVTTSAHPDKVVALFPRVIPTGIQHGTVTVLSGSEHVEVTTYRVELGYTDGRRPTGVAFSPHLALDLERRDFTMNAMAWNPGRGAFVDLHGGVDDLAARRIRAVGDPLARFREDGLRSLRALRFASVLQLDVEAETLAAMGPTRDVFRRVSAERVQVELFKLLLGPAASVGVTLLAETGLLEDTLPGFSAGLTVHERARVSSALGRAPRDLVVRLAVLLSARGAAALGAPLDDLDRLKASIQLRAQVKGALAAMAMPPLAPDATDADVRRRCAAIGRAHFEAFAQAAEAVDEPASLRLVQRARVIAALESPLTVKDLSLDGRAVQALLGVPPSRRIGALLEALLDHVLEAPERNTPEALRDALPELDRRLPVTGPKT